MPERCVLVTGGAGFIGSHVVDCLRANHPNYRVVVVDSLTYAGNRDNLSSHEGSAGFVFHQADVRDREAMEGLLSRYGVDYVVHLAAESHVDRSIADPLEFARVNVLGTLSLLEACRSVWSGAYGGHRFYQISTDEVYGSLGVEGVFREEMAYRPRSPYSASKASADHFVRAYGETYGLPVLLSCCSNNYGPRQHVEKLIPLSIVRVYRGEPVPIYGTGQNVRDWLYVVDHARAIDAILHRGRLGETYNVGGGTERCNLDLVRSLCRVLDECLGRGEGESERLIEFVADRLGHDFRYAIDSSKLRAELGWAPRMGLDEGLRETVVWYLTGLGGRG